MRRVSRPAKSLDAARLLLLRRRIKRWLPARPGLLAGLALLALGAVGLGFAIVDTTNRQSHLSDTLLAASGQLGLRVEDITVTGRELTSAADLLAALGASRGTPLLAVDPELAKRRLENLPWVRTATVERRLPDTLLVRLSERQPLALWQRHGKIVLVDRDGVTVATDHLEAYAGLLLVVGEDAPRHAEALIHVLETQPALMKRVTAAIWVGLRRWDLRLDNGIDVQLPENEYDAAWAHLATMDRDHGLLARDVERVDLRLGDRVVLKLPAEPAKPAPGSKPAHPKNGTKTT